MQEEKEYQELEKELQSFKKMMAQASDAIVGQEVSSYPVFALHKNELEIGIPLKEYGGNTEDWAIHASTLEEFVAKQIVQSDKVNDFKKIYKPASTHLCLFVISKTGATFVFLPRS